ncbi:MAG: iron-containing alcohol dehydrogenase [Eubacterium sp.]|nr:iron-containing alcohol dehydrogenase [Eubacterium sp.]MBQ9062444.1 iron-containing alcohol dehydrogenase [Eubacterium sp.]
MAKNLYIVNSYSPVRVIFGAGRLQELATVKLPGKHALLCVTADHIMEKMGVQQKVLELLKENGVEVTVYDEVVPNPTRASVMKASKLANDSGCDFFIGLGGGSSIDTAKAAAIMNRMPGDLWDYANSESGGRKEVTDAAPVVVISTTAGTGTECDYFCVITNEETGEKLDFGLEAIFPTVSIIDPELMMSLPKGLTAFQGIDALFHAVENYICNAGESKLIELYAEEAIRLLTEWLPLAVEDGNNLEARTNVAYAACVLEGYNQALTFVTSHHILGQALGGVFPKFPHGATLSTIAEAYYKEIKQYIPEDFEKLGEFMGEPSVPGDPGQSYINGLTKLMDKIGIRKASMSQFGVDPSKFQEAIDTAVDVVGIDMDRYELSKDDLMRILMTSWEFNEA